MLELKKALGAAADLRRGSADIFSVFNVRSAPERKHSPKSVQTSKYLSNDEGEFFQLNAYIFLGEQAAKVRNRHILEINKI